jgi:hypothetical protein
VVGHEAIGQDGHTGLDAAARHEGLIGTVVVIGEEGALPSVPALGDVMRDSRDNESSEPRHAQTVVDSVAALGPE